MIYRASILNVCLIAFLFLHLGVQGQRKSKNTTILIEQPTLKTTPDLVVGIVVDQMRYDYLSRFWNRFGEGGFKRFVNNGFNCKNNHLKVMLPPAPAPDMLPFIRVQTH